MSPSPIEITHRAAQAATPIYQVRDDEVDRVVAALPALIAGARPAWHRSHRKWVSKEIAAFHPADPLQTLLAGYIVVLRHVAASTRSAADLGPRTPAQACRQERSAAKLMRAAECAKAALLREQKRAARRGGARSTDGFGSAAPDALCGTALLQRGTEGIAEVASPISASPRAPIPVALPAPTPGSSIRGQALVRSSRPTPAARTRRTNAAATEAAE
jgi:hypothetical protein